MTPANRPGDRVRFVSTTDAWSRMKPGTRGTVTFVDDLGTVHVKWDDGGTLGLIAGEDRWETLTGAESR
jgi:hypothetical protein